MKRDWWTLHPSVPHITWCWIHGMEREKIERDDRRRRRRREVCNLIFIPNQGVFRTAYYTKQRSVIVFFFFLFSSFSNVRRTDYEDYEVNIQVCTRRESWETTNNQDDGWCFLPHTASPYMFLFSLPLSSVIKPLFCSLLHPPELWDDFKKAVTVKTTRIVRKITKRS